MPVALRRSIILVGVAALMAVAARNAAFHALLASNPSLAQRLWPSHPDARIGKAQQLIASAAGEGKPVPPAAFDLMAEAAAAAPLAPEPFVVHGIRSNLEMRPLVADAAFVAARNRAPRELPARYFLATNMLKRGDLRGLREAAAMARIAPNGVSALAPFLADFARRSSEPAKIRAMFADYPEVAVAVLDILAKDRANLSQVVRIGGIGKAEKAPWLPTMIATLVAAGDYGEARQLWARMAGQDPGNGSAIIDPTFTNAAAPPPFNWALTSSSIGLAERQSGRLHVLFYGQSDGPLARQLLLLKPGRYRFTAPATGARNAGQLMWVMSCANRPDQPLATAPLDRQAMTVEIPANCGGQWLELVGRAGDVASESEASVGPVAIEGARS